MFIVMHLYILSFDGKGYVKGTFSPFFFEEQYQQRIFYQQNNSHYIALLQGMKWIYITHTIYIYI